MTPPPRYIEARPCAALAPYVQCFWGMTAHASIPLPSRVLPDGCIDILMDLGSSSGRDAMPPRLRIVGAMQQAEVVPLSGEACFVGIRFRPGGAHPFLRLPVHELTDGHLALGSLWPHVAREWEERLWGTEGLRARLALLEQLLLRRLSSASLDAALAHAVGLIQAARGRLQVESLEDVLGVGSRQLERRFRATVGLAPKVLCRIARMQHAVALLEHRPETAGAELALSAGYYDQAHLIREFRALTGLSPGAYVREQTQVGFVQSAGEGRL
ncbi:AraC family transcriptional regulator [Vitiosangium sp. GDMCC 1.1324]|uniref:helix-turn-helix domain-containing protein n=1 Tax=Vitiosangium sp. (strain GDMCC 1.1324) TaxID=2138576 RepID=UPI000D36AFED|nr:AraC family transcriptional regulator [Vitiosangium sp. GDMCC 1.1324]PTL82190.1 AraC family transcriptional regulator [Vitiosangium sp. GDMCC 1.1324]